MRWNVCGRRIGDSAVLPVRERVGAQPPRVIDESHCEHQAALFIHQRETAGTQPIVVTVITELELLGAAERGYFAERLRRIVGGLQAVLDAVAGRIEFREELPVVELQRVEIAVGKRDHALARAALIHGHGLLKDGLVDEHAFAERVLVARQRTHVCYAQDYRFELRDLSRVHLQAHAKSGRRDRLLHHPEETHLAVLRVGELQLVIAETGDRAPQAIADGQLHVVLGETRVGRPRQLRGVFFDQGVEVLVHEAVQARAIACRRQRAMHERRLFLGGVCARRTETQHDKNGTRDRAFERHRHPPSWT